MEVYIVLRHSWLDYHNVNKIISVCLTEEIANKKVKECENEPGSRDFTYWYEEYILETDYYTVTIN